MTKNREVIIFPDSLEDIVNYIIYRTARILKLKFRKDMEASGMDLTQEQYFIMFKLWLKDGQSQTELSDNLFQDYPNITRILDNLEKKKYVKRSMDQTDRRKFRIFLTEKGKKLHQIYLKDAPKSRRDDYSNLKDEDLNTLKHILSVIEKNIVHKLNIDKS